MKQQSSKRTSWSGRRMVLGALAAALVFGGAAMHLNAPPTWADCQSSNGVTMVAGTGSATCATAVGGGSAVAQSSSVSTSGTASTTSTTVIASSDGSGTAVAQSSEGSSDGTLVMQSSDATPIAAAVCPQAGVAAGPSLALGPGFVLGAGVVCGVPLPAPVVSPPASGSLALIGSGRCGSPSLVVGPGGIALSSGGC